MTINIRLQNAANSVIWDFSSFHDIILFLAIFQLAPLTKFSLSLTYVTDSFGCPKLVRYRWNNGNSTFPTTRFFQLPVIQIFIHLIHAGADGWTPICWRVSRRSSTVVGRARTTTPRRWPRVWSCTTHRISRKLTEPISLQSCDRQS